MALDLTALLALRDALLTARYRGLRSCTDQNGEAVTWSSDREYAAKLADIEARIVQMQSGTVNVIKFRNSKFGE
jgi:hypothetical protein